MEVIRYKFIYDIIILLRYFPSCALPYAHMPDSTTEKYLMFIHI